jgi:hypothetical protein
MFAKQSNSNYIHNNKEWSFGNPRIIDKSQSFRDTQGMNFAHGGRTYYVNINPRNQTISVDEKYQDKDNKWHTKKNGFFAQGEDAETLAKDSGGWYINTIVDYLDGAGALQELNERKS